MRPIPAFVAGAWLVAAAPVSPVPEEWVAPVATILVTVGALLVDWLRDRRARRERDRAAKDRPQ